MKTTSFAYLIFSLILFNACYNAKKNSINDNLKPERHKTELNDFKFDASLIVGSWIDTSESALHFTLFENGTARSDNMATLLYKKWRLEDTKLILTAESIGNIGSSIDDKTYQIHTLTKEKMILIHGELLWVFSKKN